MISLRTKPTGADNQERARLVREQIERKAASSTLEIVREKHTDPDLLRRIVALEQRMAELRHREPVTMHVAQSDDRLVRLALWAIRAVRAEHAGAPYNDFRWHGGKADFTWEGARYDAPSFLEYAHTELVRIETSGST